MNSPFIPIRKQFMRKKKKKFDNEITPVKIKQKSGEITIASDEEPGQS